MTWQTGLLVTLVVLWATAQYGLAGHALRDLRQRPRVRGNNKIVWALVILGVPIAGALVYTVYGPTSFIRRDRPRSAAVRNGAAGDRAASARPQSPSSRAKKSQKATAATISGTSPTHKLPEIPDVSEETVTVTPTPDSRNVPPLVQPPIARQGRR